MKVYKAKNDNDMLLTGKEYVGYIKGARVFLTHVASSDRIVQLYSPIITDPINLELISDSAEIGLNHNAKPIPRGNRGVR
tara:strand:+ start:7970 stop:8209 length:240 start_codon:yes stop_codon:yes gene_type:complete